MILMSNICFYIFSLPHYSCRYFAIAFVNYIGKKVKIAKGALSVIYQIHLAGHDKPLAYTPLNEAWSDGIYYFMAMSFKRSGQYTVSFIAEGENAVNIKPLVFQVNVEAQVVHSGPRDALNKLRASGYVAADGRLFWSALQQPPLKYSFDTDYSELGAVKHAIAAVYAALPIGSVVLDTESSISAITGSRPLADRDANASEVNVFACMAEPVGWNDMLDATWRGAVHSASSPVALMECVLLLEYYINKQWLAAPAARLLTALPNPHFAMRCCSLSAVALRVFCLDRALSYEKVRLATLSVASLHSLSRLVYRTTNRWQISQRAIHLYI